MCPIYTKTFGGKIWNNLHSVSPDNFLGKKFKMASLTTSRQKFFAHRLVQKIESKRQICFLPVKQKSEKKYCLNLVAKSHRNLVFQTLCTR